ncbi:hypothetical protein GW781_14400 [bacterium]|nr:hypothetical protein [bacterium]NCT22330.1 hypothetical protein [bacterium]
MELLLALAVVTAVIIFGALISLGNERQRKAIDALREQAVLWAIQDLRIKREKWARDVRVDDPLGWLNRIAARVCGFDLRLQVVEAFDEPRALVCSTGDGSGRVVFTPLSPDDIRRFRKEKRGRLSQVAAQSPLLLFPHQANIYEISALNSGIAFDMELPLAWNGLTGQKINQTERMWMYLLP